MRKNICFAVISCALLFCVGILFIKTDYLSARSANRVSTPQFEKDAIEDRVVINLDRPVDISWFTLKARNQVVFDLKDAFFPDGLLVDQVDSRIVQTIRTSQHKEDVVRVTLGLRPDCNYNFSTNQRRRKNSHVLSLSVYPMIHGGLPSQISGTLLASSKTKEDAPIEEKPGQVTRPIPPKQTGPSVAPYSNQVSAPLFKEKGNEEQVLIKLNHPVDVSWFRLESQDRIVVDLKDTFIPEGFLSNEVNSQIIKAIRTGQHKEDIVRVTLELEPGSVYNFSTTQGQVQGSPALFLCLSPEKHEGPSFRKEPEPLVAEAEPKIPPSFETEPDQPVQGVALSPEKKPFPPFLAHLSMPKLETSEGQDQITINLNRPVDASWFSLKSPDRIVVDIKNAFIPEKVLSQAVNSPNIKSIRAAQNQKDVVRVVLDLKPGGPRQFSTTQKIVDDAHVLTLCLGPEKPGIPDASQAGTVLAAAETQTEGPGQPGEPEQDFKTASLQSSNRLSAPEFEIQGNEEQVLIKLDRPVDTAWYIKESPDRIVVDIKDAVIPEGVLDKEIHSDKIKSIHASQEKEDVVRVVLALQPDSKYEFSTAQGFVEGDHVLFLSLAPEKGKAPPAPGSGDILVSSLEEDQQGPVPEPGQEDIPPFLAHADTPPVPEDDAAPLNRLSDPQFKAQGSEEQILIKVDRPVAMSWSTEKSPGQIIVNIRDAVIGEGGLTRQINAQKIQSIQASQETKDMVQLVLNLQPDSAVEFSTAQGFVDGSHALSLRIGPEKGAPAQEDTGDVLASAETQDMMPSAPLQPDQAEPAMAQAPASPEAGDQAAAMLANRLSDPTYSAHGNVEQILIKLDRPVATSWTALESSGQIMVDIKGAVVPEGGLTKEIHSKKIKSLQASQAKEDVVRLVLNLEPDSDVEFSTAQGFVEGSHVLSFRLGPGKEIPAEAAAPALASLPKETRAMAPEQALAEATGPIQPEDREVPYEPILSTQETMAEPRVEPVAVETTEAEGVAVAMAETEPAPGETGWVEMAEAETAGAEIAKAETVEPETAAVEVAETEAPEVQAPEVKAPEAETAGVKIAEAQAPEIETTEPEAAEAEKAGIETAQAETAEVPMAETKTPEAIAPEIETAVAEAPEAETPEVKTAPVEAPEIETAEAEADTAREETAEQQDLKISGLVQARGTLQVADQGAENETSFRNRVILEADYKDMLVVSALSDYLYFGPDDKTSDYDLDLYEAKLQYQWENVTVSLGKQIVRWGKMDRISPVDTLNPQDLREFNLPDYEDRKIPVWMADIRYTFNGFTLEGVVIPFFEENRQNYFQSNWSMFGHIKKEVADSNLSAFQKAYFENLNVHEEDPDNETEWGVRLSASVRDLDFGFTYHYATEDNPYYESFPVKNISVADGLSPDDFTAGTYQNEDIEVEYRKTSIAGLEFETAVAGFGIRGEAAWYENESFLTTSLTSVRKPTFTYAIGADYTTKANTYLNFQVAHRYVADFDDTILYAEENETSLLGEIRLNAFVDWLQACVKYTKPLNNDSFYLNPYLKLSYITNLDCRIGAGIYSGDSDTRLGRFEDQDVYYLDVTYRF